jgi:hypothetical protein
MSKMVIRMRVAVFLLALVLSFTTGAARGADANKQYGVRTFDKLENCVALNQAVKSAKKYDDWRALYGFSLYLMGYLTGINRMAFDTYDIGGRKNSKILMVWLQDYCAANPEASFNTALHQLIIEVYPERSTTAPLTDAP